jgi:acetylornithine deacetylase/succinyl-diaminopimelate desuccinylase-like protein
MTSNNPIITSAALDYAHHHKNDFLAELFELLQIPSVSTDPEYGKEIENAAVWLVSKLKAKGFNNVTKFTTSGHPIVFAEKISLVPDAPTLLIYGHYDVQPADPYSLWDTLPFDPTVKGEYLFARGASDMKGQIIVALAAFESLLSQGQFPINIKWILEGEEEIGSPSMDTFLEEHTDLLSCDISLNLDCGMIACDSPTITYALRGLAYFEILISGPKADLHSGLFGGVVHNPAQILAELISGMHNKDGRVTLPGFYDNVRPLEAEERVDLSRLPLDESFYLSQSGAPQLWGEKGYSPVERIGARPTLDINGLFSGYTAAGAKTIIPSTATAKLSMRLVPDQTPDEIENLLTDYFNKNTPPTVRWDLITHAKGNASITSRSSKFTLAFNQALLSVWGVSPLYKREGGSIPIVEKFQSVLSADSILSGFSLPEDNIHAPNEKLHLPTWYNGIDAVIHFIQNLYHTGK